MGATVTLLAFSLLSVCVYCLFYCPLCVHPQRLLLSLLTCAFISHLLHKSILRILWLLPNALLVTTAPLNWTKAEPGCSCCCFRFIFLSFSLWITPPCSQKHFSFHFLFLPVKFNKREEKKRKRVFESRTGVCVSWIKGRRCSSLCLIEWKPSQWGIRRRRDACQQMNVALKLAYIHYYLEIQDARLEVLFGWEPNFATKMYHGREEKRRKAEREREREKEEEKKKRREERHKLTGADRGWIGPVPSFTCIKCLSFGPWVKSISNG